MSAYIVEAPKLAVLAAQHKNSFAEKLRRDVISGVFQLAAMAQQHPFPLEDHFLLEFEELRVLIDPGGQGVEARPGLRFGLVLRFFRGQSRKLFFREFPGKDAAKKTSASRPGTLQVEGTRIPQHRLGERGKQVMESPPQGLDLQVGMASRCGYCPKGLHPFGLEFGFTRRADTHVIVPRTRLPPERRPNRHPVSVAELGIEGRRDHGLEAQDRIDPRHLHGLALARHVLPIDVLEGREQ